MLPHGGGLWGKKKGGTMVTHGNSSRCALSQNLCQRISTTSRGANSVTLWMLKTTICTNMWRPISKSCLRSDTCMNWIVCANFWWGSPFGPSGSLRKIGPPHYPRPSWKWKASRMWDEVKNPRSRRTSFHTKSHAMRGNGIEGKEAQQKINPNNSKAWGLNPRGTLWRRGLLSKWANQREILG